MRTSSPSLMSCCTAMMSARGIMRSPTRRSRRPRMLRSIRLSSGEKPDSPGVMASSTSLSSARVVPGASRTACGWRAPASSRRSRRARRHRHGQIARLVARRLGLVRDRSQASRSGIARFIARGKGRRCAIRARYRAPAAPSFRRRNRSRDRSPTDAESHAPQDGRDDAGTACPAAALSRASVS